MASETCTKERGRTWRVSVTNRGHQGSSGVLRGPQRSPEVLRGSQRSSEVLRGHQRAHLMRELDRRRVYMHTVRDQPKKGSARRRRSFGSR
jgi:hypothetical protein